MEALFLCREGDQGQPKVVVLNQALSLRNSKIQVHFFILQGTGLKSYIRNLFILKKYIKKNEYDIYHAHYSLSGIIAALAGCAPLIVSLMGSEGRTFLIEKPVIQFFSNWIWNATIVKSKSIQEYLNLKKSILIPNGIELNKGKKIDKILARKTVGFNSKKQILFLADPNRKEKNFQLVEKAYELLNHDIIELQIINNIPHSLVPYYLYASDVLVLSSKWEGSPNVIKEAMACNLPIVSTDVGDVKELILKTEGCFIADFDHQDFASKITLAIAFSKTNGRKNIEHLDALLINQKLIRLYKSLLIK